MEADIFPWLSWAALNWVAWISLGALVLLLIVIVVLYYTLGRKPDKHKWQYPDTVERRRGDD